MTHTSRRDPSRLRPLLWTAAFGATLAIVPSAWADGPKAPSKGAPSASKASKSDTKPVAPSPASTTSKSARSATPDALFERLPVGELKTPTKLTVPNSIPRGESVDGVYLEVPDYILKNPAAGTRYAQVFASKEDAKARSSGQPIVDDDSCFMAASPAFNGETEVRWNGSIGASVAVSPYPKSYSYGAAGATPKDMINVLAIRADRVTNATNDKVTLDSRVVFVDAQTLGARLVSEDKVEFALIKELPGRVKIYGARSNDLVTFLVKRQKHPAERFPMGGMFVQQGINGGMSSSDECHVTFTMPAKSATASTAVLQLEAILDIKEPGADDDKTATAPSTFDGPQAMPMAVPGGPREGHIRTMEVGFSSTWLSQDKAPVISLTHGWLGRERTQQM